MLKWLRYSQIWYNHTCIQNVLIHILHWKLYSNILTQTCRNAYTQKSWFKVFPLYMHMIFHKKQKCRVWYSGKRTTTDLEHIEVTWTNRIRRIRRLHNSCFRLICRTDECTKLWYSIRYTLYIIAFLSAVKCTQIQDKLSSLNLYLYFRTGEINIEIGRWNSTWRPQVQLINVKPIGLAMNLIMF